MVDSFPLFHFRVDLGEGRQGHQPALGAAADGAGKPIYLEMSSVNPVFILPGVLAERGVELAGEFAGSCMLATGQFCTNPGLVVLPTGEAGEKFVETAVSAPSCPQNYRVSAIPV